MKTQSKFHCCRESAHQDHAEVKARSERLIAAAPELLAVLEAVVQAANNLAVALTDDQISEAMQCLALETTKSISAISRAKGDS